LLVVTVPFLVNVMALEPLEVRAAPTTVGVPVVLAQSPSTSTSVGLAGQGQVGVPIIQSATSTSTSVTPTVGVPMNQGGSETLSSATSSGIVGTPTASSKTTGAVGTPIALSSAPSASASGMVGTPISTSNSFFLKHSISSLLPNYAVLIIFIVSGLILVTLIGVIVWRVQKYRHTQRETEEDEEDILEAYAKYWKAKRDSTIVGHSGRGHISTPTLEEKMGRNSYI
jgi:beta-lactamase regulating signal transducer with metallopeptidase domain